MRPGSDTRACELGMRVLLMVQSAVARDQDFLLADVARAAEGRFGISRATAFRQVRRAVDVLAIPYHWSATRAARIDERRSEGQANARLIGHVPGRKRRA